MEWNQFYSRRKNRAAGLKGTMTNHLWSRKAYPEELTLDCVGTTHFIVWYPTASSFWFLTGTTFASYHFLCLLLLMHISRIWRELWGWYSISIYPRHIIATHKWNNCGSWIQWTSSLTSLNIEWTFIFVIDPIFLICFNLMVNYLLKFWFFICSQTYLGFLCLSYLLLITLSTTPSVNLGL